MTAEADAVAGRVADAAGVRVRTLSALADLAAACRLFDEIWRPDPASPPMTPELLRALTKAGSYVAGAYDGEPMVAASVGFFGPPAERTLHSHITGVVPAGLRRGVGFALKLHQRAWALRRGAAEVAWTFDPLIRRNAYFNMVKLGARPAEYLPNFYGGMNDGINGGGDTDRLLVRWDLRSPDVAAACAGRLSPASARDELARGAATVLSVAPDGRPALGGRPAPNAGTAGTAGGTAGTAGGTAGTAGTAGTTGITAGTAGTACTTGTTAGTAGTAGGTMLVAVPADIERLRGADPASAAAWRAALRDVLEPAMAAGARVTGFDQAGWYIVRTEEGAG